MKNDCSCTKIFPVLLFLTFVLSACKFESNRFTLSNNLDNLTGQNVKSQLTDSISHSGKYSSFVSPSSPYGFSLGTKFREISNKKIKKIRVSFYAYEKDSASGGTMVFQVKNANNEAVFWRSAKAYEMIVPGRWCIVTQEYDVSQENFKADDEARIYPWCRGTGETFFDDYLVEFYW